MKNILYITGVLLITTSLYSCKKEFLQIVPTDRVSESAIKGDSSLFISYVINRYMGERLTNKEAEGTPPGFGRGFEYAMWSSLTDESIYNNDDDTWLIQRGLLSPENLGIAGTFWGRNYKRIRDINYALSIIDQVKMSDFNKNKLTGELKFLRGFAYFDLLRNYGRLVLMGNKVYNLGDDMTNDSLFVRSSIPECVNYIKSELDEAITLLPLNNDNSWLLGRATKGAARALKSKLLLYAASPLYNAGTWADAESAAKELMDMNKYSLFQGGYRQLFLTPLNNPEIIFERLYTARARHVCLEISNGPNGYGGWAGNTPLQNLVDAYQMSNGKSITNPTSGYNPNNPYINRDPRLYASILFNGAPYRGRNIETFVPGGRDSKDGPSNWNTSKTGYYLKKFTDDNLPIDNPWNVAGTQSWIYFRFAEILLNFAEARNEATGPDVQVYNAVNLVRQRSGVDMPALPTGLSQTEMRTAIRNERQVELAFEEHRFYDVRRWKIAEQTENIPAYGIDVIKNADGSFTYNRKTAITGKIFKSQHYWLPIPRSEILASNNKLEQNPNY